MEKLLVKRRVNPLEFFNSTKRIIEKMTEVSNDHMTPELSLRLVTPNCPLWTENHKECPLPDPFWAFYWPGGQALTRYLLDNRDIISGRNVLDVGSGCGSLAIAAAKLNLASSVTANDIDPVAEVAIKLNSSLNNVHLNVMSENLVGNTELVKKYNCILLGDMFYDEHFTGTLMKWLLTFLENGLDIFIGDPGRHSKFCEDYQNILEKVAEYEVTEEYKKLNDLTKNTLDIWKLSFRNKV